MAVPKPLLVEFGIHCRIKERVVARKTKLDNCVWFVKGHLRFGEYVGRYGHQKNN